MAAERVKPAAAAEAPGGTVHDSRDSNGSTPRPAPAQGRVAGAAGPLGRIPDFFIIGHERSGTTALYEMLKSHPQIFMPDLKEPRFFARDPDAPAPTRTGGIFPRTLESYLALFDAASPEQRVGEASPQYIRSPGAASRIADVAPSARIIAILREPVSFLRSLHLLRVKADLETEGDLRKALAMEEHRRQGRQLPDDLRAPREWLLYSEHVRYVEQLRSYAAVFAPEQMLVLIYDDFRRDNLASIRRVLRFLEVDESAPIELTESGREQRKAVRSSRLNRMTRALVIARRNPASSGPILRTVSSLLPRRLRPLWRRVIYTPARPLDEGLARELRSRFKGEVVALSEYLGRDLVTEWGYDDID